MFNFFYFKLKQNRSLRNARTKIHKNLFVAMIIQVIIRLTLYLDQAIVKDNQHDFANESTVGIQNTVSVFLFLILNNLNF